MTVGGEGTRSPPTNGEYYDTKVITNTNEADELFPFGTETGSFIVKMWDSQGVIYIGWDEEVDENNGFPLEDGEWISIDLDASSQEVYVYGDTEGDELRILATN